MARRPNSVPTYRLHKPSGQAVISLRLGNGSRRDVYLGMHNTPESRQEYARILKELAVSPSSSVNSPLASRGSDLTVNELLLAFMKHASDHYRHSDGRPTSEIHNWNSVVRVTSDFYGHTLVREFGPLALKVLQKKLIEAGLSRKTVNRRAAGVRHIFKWGMGEQLVSSEIYTALTAVSGLQRGRTTAHDPEPIGPVADAVVDATLPFLNRHVRGLVEFQRLTGCRPGEACLVRPIDIDMSRPVWLFKPGHHKTSHKGKSRTIHIGPKAQELLRAFITPDGADFCFSPAKATEEHHAHRAALRKTPRYASHEARNAAKRSRAPHRKPYKKYTSVSLNRAVSRACLAAFPPPEPLAKRERETLAQWKDRLTPEQKQELAAWQRGHHWHANQLRHGYATKVRKEHGLEAVQVLLGHSKADVTQIYAEKNESLAAIVAVAIG